MKKEIAKTLANRIRFLRRCGWSIKKIMDKFKLSRTIVKKICLYEIEEKRTNNAKRRKNESVYNTEKNRRTL